MSREPPVVTICELFRLAPVMLTRTDESGQGCVNREIGVFSGAIYHPDLEKAVAIFLSGRASDGPPRALRFLHSLGQKDTWRTR